MNLAAIPSEAGGPGFAPVEARSGTCAPACARFPPACTKEKFMTASRHWWDSPYHRSRPLNFMKFLQLKFIPQSTDFALLLLRVVAGLTLLLNHGWSKATNFGTISDNFINFLGLGQTVSLGLIVFAEVVCSALLVAGWLSRFAALVIAIGMGVAFVVGHGMKLSGPGNGELAFLFLVMAATLFFAGPGKFSVDSKQGAA